MNKTPFWRSPKDYDETDYIALDMLIFSFAIIMWSVYVLSITL